MFAVYYVVLGFMFMPDDTDWSLEDWMVSVDLALKFGLCGERICRWGPVVLIAMPMVRTILPPIEFCCWPNTCSTRARTFERAVFADFWRSDSG